MDLTEQFAKTQKNTTSSQQLMELSPQLTTYLDIKQVSNLNRDKEIDIIPYIVSEPKD